MTDSRLFCTRIHEVPQHWEALAGDLVYMRGRDVWQSILHWPLNLTLVRIPRDSWSAALLLFGIRIVSYTVFFLFSVNNNQVSFEDNLFGYNDNGDKRVHVISWDKFGSYQVRGQTLTEVNLLTSGRGTPSGRIWIEYCGVQLSVFVNNGGDSKPSSPVLSVPFDASSLFDVSQPVYLGFTSGAWEASHHDIMSWQLNQDCALF